MNDPVNSPAHYTALPAACVCGRPLEPIEFTRHMNFNLGNAVKYVLRAPFKGRQEEDLRKAIWYLNDELKRLGAATVPRAPIQPPSPRLAEINRQLKAMPTAPVTVEEHRAEAAAQTASPVAMIHNPFNLTEEQIGTAEGWRLADWAEFQDKPAPNDLEVRIYAGDRWLESNCRLQSFPMVPGYAYRTKVPRA